MAELLKTQTVVIGAGVIGLAVARALALAGQEVIVLEATDQFGSGISSRNSEVIHAGIYYPEGSMKARLCVAGRRALYEYCRRHKIGHRRCGMWIVATSPEQTGLLEDIQRKATGNGVRLTWMAGEDLARKLPDIRADAALWSPETGIVDSHGLMLSLLGDLEDHGGQLAVNTPVRSMTPRTVGWSMCGWRTRRAT